MPKSKHRRKPTGGSQNAGSTGATADAGVAEKADDAGRSQPRVSPVEFFRQVRDEGRKITWTSRNETMISTVMVLIMVLVMSIFFFAVDEVLRRLIPFILNMTA